MASTPAIVPLDEEKDDDQTSQQTETTIDIDNSNKADNTGSWRVVLSTYLIIFSDALSINLPGPYVADMCEKRFGISPTWVGIAVGALVGMFSISTFLTGSFIGHLSDTYGRKPVLLVGLASSAIFGFFFGLSPYFWLALMLRSAVGLTNANFAIGKAVISDVTTGTQRALSFGYLGAAFAISRALSSALGGLTVGYIIFPWGILNNGYVLPSFIGTVINTSVFFFTLFFHPETRIPSKTEEKAKNPGLINGLRVMIRDPLMRKLIIISCLQSFCNGSFMLSLAVYPPSSVSVHGLDASPSGIGWLYFFFGISGFLFSLFCFKAALRRFDIIQVYKAGLVITAVSSFLFPIASLFYWIWGVTSATKALTWIWLILTASSMATGFMIGLPVVNTFFSNISDPNQFGLIQGSSQSLMDFIRALGPVLTGPLFSLSIYLKFPFFVYWLLLPMYAICFFIIRNLTQEEKDRCLGKHVDIELKPRLVKKITDTSKEASEESQSEEHSEEDAEILKK